MDAFENAGDQKPLESVLSCSNQWNNGKADPLSVPVTPARPIWQAVENSEEEKVAQPKSLKPRIIDGIAASYVNDKRNNKAFLEEVEGVRLGRATRFFRGSMYG